MTDELYLLLGIANTPVVGQDDGSDLDRHSIRDLMRKVELRLFDATLKSIALQEVTKDGSFFPDEELLQKRNQEMEEEVLRAAPDTRPYILRKIVAHTLAKYISQPLVEERIEKLKEIEANTPKVPKRVEDRKKLLSKKLGGEEQLTKAELRKKTLQEAKSLWE